ncbi:MAG: hypothetical protein NTZ33_15365 [Bacteroidetes bacterium]|nr:hypothetical protein [Bacteroidota bacterium]
MDKAIIKENINRQLEIILEQNNTIQANTGKIPQIEIDILKANIRKFYEQYCELEHANTIAGIDKSKEIKEVIPSVIAEIKETKENPLLIVHDETKADAKPGLSIETTSILVDEKIEVVFTPEPKAIVEEKAFEIKEEETPVEIPQPNAKTDIPIDLFGNAPTIADKYKIEKESLNEKLQKTKTDKSIGTRMQHHAIKDLKSSIGINEKFLFINELFKGNMKEYNESILIFNNSANLKDAIDVLNGLKEKHMWKEDMPAYLTLKDFVERKHM